MYLKASSKFFYDRFKYILKRVKKIIQTVTRARLYTTITLIEAACDKKRASIAISMF